MNERINYVIMWKLIQIKFIASATVARKLLGPFGVSSKNGLPESVGGKNLKRTRTEWEESEGRNEGQTCVEKKKEEEEEKDEHHSELTRTRLWTQLLISQMSATGIEVKGRACWYGAGPNSGSM